MMTLILYALLAGAMMPLGAWLARWEQIHPNWHGSDFAHGVMAFGGGALLSAVALILVPDGAKHLHPLMAVAVFLAGAGLMAALDAWMANSGSRKAQLIAMLSDFAPEAVALGALASFGSPAVPLLAVLMALQNLPEGFNAGREAMAQGRTGARVVRQFSVMALLGPVAALLGYFLLAGQPAFVGGLMLAAGGGILYLVFQDIAPDAHVEKNYIPALGAAYGFALGLMGHLLVPG